MAAFDNSAEGDSSAESVISDDWQEVKNSDFAKVIFSELSHNPIAGTVECKFQITDNVHEDPCDFVGLYQIGYDNPSEHLAFKYLSDTKCEDDGKLQHCVLKYKELPCLKNGYYQFLYVTRDYEICGASTPLKIQPDISVTCLNSSQSSVHLKEISSASDDDITEKAENDFLLVNGTMQRKNKKLKKMLKNSEESKVKLREEFEQIKGENASLKNVLTNSEESKVKLKEEFEQIKEENADLKAKSICLATCRDALKDKKEEIASQLAAENIKRLNLESNITKLNICIQSLNKEISSKSLEHDNLKKKYEDLELKYKNSTAKYEKEIESLMTQVALHRDAIAERNEIIESKSDEIKKYVKANTTLLNDNENLSMEVEKLKNDFQRISTVHEHYRMQNVQQQNLIQQKKNQDEEMLVEQLEDQKCMIKALEDSKQLALKEVNGLSESLKKHVQQLNLSSEELHSLKRTLKEQISDLEKKDQEIIKLKQSNMDFKIQMFSGEDIISKQDIKIMNLRKEAIYWRTKFNDQLTKSQTKSNSNDIEKCRPCVLKEASQKIKELHILIKELIDKTDFYLATDKNSFFDIKTQLIILQSKMRKPDNYNASERVSRQPSQLCSCQIQTESSESSVQAENSSDITLDIPSSPFNNIHLVHITEEMVSGISNLDMADVNVVNALTKKFMGYKPGLKVINELLSDSSEQNKTESDMHNNEDSDISFDKSVLAIEKVLAALREHLNSSGDLFVFEGYNAEFSVLHPKVQIDLLLRIVECHYFEYIVVEGYKEKSKDMKKARNDLKTMATSYNVWKDIVESERRQLDAQLSDKEMTISELVANKAVTAKFMKELRKINSEYKQREFSLQESVNELTDRINTAAKIYKAQFLLIEKLNRKLKKLECYSKYKTPERKKETQEASSWSFPISSEATPSIKDAAQNISDSDTGEHVLGKAASLLNKETECQGTEKSLGARPKLKVFRRTPLFADNVFSGLHTAPIKSDNTINPFTNKPASIPPSTISIETKNATSTADIRTDPIRIVPTNPENISSFLVNTETRNQISAAKSGFENKVIRKKDILKDPRKFLPRPPLPQTLTEAKEKKDAMKKIPAVKNVGAIQNMDAMQKVLTDFFLELRKLPGNEELENKVKESHMMLSCSACNQNFFLNSEICPFSLLEHLEKEHQLRTCFICGQMFDESVPKKYFYYHLDNHFGFK
ncbi:SKICH domain-containing protein [Caerostris darwini]|uniref:SKICH domain-containing protein n=1 Tax=Caerostris darwini TaxID=1538125 RepID=A0AAV4U3H7_9ARAC|nr:SKICH domain-containing protein [Caerostris darwini]